MKKVRKKKQIKNKTKFGTVSSLTSGTAGSDVTKIIIGQNSVAGNANVKNPQRQQNNITAFLSRIRGNLVNISQTEFAKAYFDFLGASEDLKAFTYKYAWNESVKLPKKFLPSPNRMAIINAIQDLVDFNTSIGEREFYIQRSGSYFDQKPDWRGRITAFGSDIQALTQQPQLLPSQSLQTAAGDDTVASGSSSEASIGSLERTTNNLLSTYMALWWLGPTAETFMITGQGPPDINEKIVDFFDKVKRYYETYFTEIQPSEENRRRANTLVDKVQSAASTIMMTPDGLAVFGMEIAYRANMQMQELYASTFFRRDLSASFDAEKRKYEEILNYANGIELTNHLAYNYAKLKKWVENSGSYKTPTNAEEWLRVQVIYFVKKRVLKIKSIFKLINFFAVNILGSDTFQLYCNVTHKASKNTTLKMCIANINVALSGLFYVQNNRKISPNEEIRDSTPTTLRNVALNIYEQLNIIDKELQMPETEPEGIAESRTPPVLPGQTAYRSLWLTLNHQERQIWLAVYNVGARILEKIVELSRISGMQPGEEYEFEDENYLTVKLERRYFWNEYFATYDESVNVYMQNWTAFINKRDTDPLITRPKKAGLSEPFYFLIRHPQNNARHFFDMETRNLYENTIVTPKVLNFRKEFYRMTGITSNYTLLDWVSKFSKNLFAATVIGSTIFQSPTYITQMVTGILSMSSNITANEIMLRNMFFMAKSFLNSSYQNIPWNAIFSNFTSKNAMLAFGSVYYLSNSWLNNQTNKDIQNIKTPQQLKTFVQEALSEIPVMKQLSDPTLKNNIINTWGIDNPNVDSTSPIRIYGIYLALLKKPGLVHAYNFLDSEQAVSLFRTLNVTEIERMLENHQNQQGKIVYDSYNNTMGLTDSNIPDTYVSTADFGTIIDSVGDFSARVISTASNIASAAVAPESSEDEEMSGSFGKLITAVQPYRQFVINVKKKGSKRGIYVKTRFGVKKIKDDKYGLYVKADGKKFHLYNWPSQ